MKFIHLTDTHLAPEPLYGIDTCERLERLAAHVRSRADGAAFAVVTGDLVNRACPKAYGAAVDILRGLDMPVFVLAGNHDDPQLMQEFFAPASEADLCGLTDKKRPALLAPQLLRTPLFDAVFLNTHQDEAPSGRVSPDDLARLRTGPRDGRPRLLFMHHAPFVSGIAAMDAAGLENAHELREALGAAAGVAGIFCGHLHRTMTGLWAGIPVWCLRSTVHAVAPEVRGTVMKGVREAPEYALVEVRRECGELTVLSQTMRFTETDACFCL